MVAMLDTPKKYGKYGAVHFGLQNPKARSNAPFSRLILD
jgi:hypothetical protein